MINRSRGVGCRAGPAAAWRIAALASAMAILLPAAAGGEPLPMPDWPEEFEQARRGTAARLAARTTLLTPRAEGRPAGAGDNSGPAATAASVLPGGPGGSDGAIAHQVPSGRLPPVAASGAADDAPAAISRPASGQPDAAAVATHPDPLTAAQIEILQSSGLLARQAEISASIIMMERQLKQVELLNRLMALQGPDVPIEVTPGKFRMFAGTPAGRRLAREIEESELKANIRILELRLQEERLTHRLKLPDPAGIPALALLPPGGEAADPALSAPAYSLLEIQGRDGEYAAVLEFGGTTLKVRSGDVLPQGQKVQSVGPDGVRMTGRGEVTELRIDG